MEKIYVVKYLGENARVTVLKNFKTIENATKYAEELASSNINYDGYKKEKFYKADHDNLWLQYGDFGGDAISVEEDVLYD